MVTVLAAIAASWGVVMALAPLLQIREIRRHRSSRSVSVAYQQVLLVGFVLWLAYGVADTNLRSSSRTRLRRWCPCYDWCRAPVSIVAS